MIEPIRLASEVDAPPQHAFEVCTTRISRWWPADHTVSAENGLMVVLEGRQGGRGVQTPPRSSRCLATNAAAWARRSRFSLARIELT